MSTIQDRWLWLGFAVTFYAASHLVRRGLLEIYTASMLTEDEISAQLPASPPPPPEDSISLEALATLVRSPNPTLASSAIRVLAARFLSDPSSYTPWLDALFSHDDRERSRAALLHRFLLGDDNMPAASASDLPLGSPMRALAPLVAISLDAGTDGRSAGRGAAAARTVRAAYSHVRASGGPIARSMLLDIGRSMVNHMDDSVLLCKGMTEFQAGPWLEAMACFQERGGRGDGGKLEDALRRMGEGAAGETGGLAAWEAELGSGMPERLASRTDGDGGPQGWREGWAGGRGRDTSYEEEEIRRRRREAIVFRDDRQDDGLLITSR